MRIDLLVEDINDLTENKKYSDCECGEDSCSYKDDSDEKDEAKDKEDACQIDPVDFFRKSKNTKTLNPGDIVYMLAKESHLIVIKELMVLNVVNFDETTKRTLVELSNFNGVTHSVMDANIFSEFQNIKNERFFDLFRLFFINPLDAFYSFIVNSKDYNKSIYYDKLIPPNMADKFSWKIKRYYINNITHINEEF
jgi:hypothetical protein